MNKSLFGKSNLCLLAAVLCGPLIGIATADDPDRASSRESMRDERPDESRGWVIVTKDSYWPLCYESLDRIQEARELVGDNKHDELADTLDKCGAWLRLAASAAMTDGESGVIGAADRFNDAADLIRAGDSNLTNDDLNNLTTLGLLSMAKSHVMRATESSVSFKAELTPKKSGAPASPGVVAQAEKEIAAERVLKLREQYRHDTVETKKHLTVAQTYLSAAAEAGGFELEPMLTAKIPAVPTDFDLKDYIEEQLSLSKSMQAFVNRQRRELVDALGNKL